MNILHLTGMNSTKYGGLERYLVELQKLNIGGGKSIYVYNSYPSNNEYVKDITKLGGEICVISPNSFIDYLKNIIKIIKEDKIDILQFHFGSYRIAPIIRILFPRIKIFALYHSEVYIPRTIRRLERRIYHSAFDKVFCVSNGAKKGLEKILGKSSKNEVLYLGVKKRPLNNYNLRNDLNISESDVVITCIGFSISIKGLDTLIQSIKLLKDKKLASNIKVLIVGVSGAENEKLLNLAKEANIQDNIISLGIRNDIDDILNISDIYTQPSRTEAISLSIMEALNYALPVVATNVGGIPEVVEDGVNGYLCEKENAKDLSEKLELLITNSKLRKQFGIESLSKSKYFSLENSTKYLYNLYKQ